MRRRTGQANRDRHARTSKSASSVRATGNAAEWLCQVLRTSGGGQCDSAEDVDPSHAIHVAQHLVADRCFKSCVSQVFEQLLRGRKFEFPMARAILMTVLHRLMVSGSDRPDRKQMVVGVVLDDEGCPICCEPLPGYSADVTTLIPMIDRLKERFGVEKVCIVADPCVVDEIPSLGRGATFGERGDEPGGKVACLPDV